MMALTKVSKKISGLKAAGTSSSSRVNIKTAITSVGNKKVQAPSWERKIYDIKLWNASW